MTGVQTCALPIFIEMKSQIRDFNNEWVRKEFIENYKSNLRNNIKNTVKIEFNIKAIDYKK